MLDILSKIYKKSRLIVLDVILLNIALAFSFYFRFTPQWTAELNYNYFILLSCIGFAVLYFSNLYQKIWQYASIPELYSIIKTAILIHLLFIFPLFMLNMVIPRSIIVLNVILTVFLLGGLRFLLRLLKDYIDQKEKSVLDSKKDIKVLIVGAGDAGEMIIREMQKHPELNKNIIGIIDDDPQKLNMEIHGKRVLGDRSQIPQIIKTNNIDEVIIAIPSATGKQIKEIYQLSNQQGVSVKTVPGIFEIINGDVNLNQIRDINVSDLLRRKPVILNTDNIMASVRNKSVLITGGGGSIGSEIARQIARFKPERIILLDIYENNLYFLDLELKTEFEEIKIIPVIASIRDRDRLEQVFREHRPDVVFHAAAHKHVPLMEYNPGEAIKNNIFGTRNVAETADKFQVERFVLISSDKAVNPTNVMGATKRAAEMFIQVINRQSKTSFMAVRFGNVLDSQGSVIPLFKKQIASKKPVTVTHPDIERYFMTIPEATQLVIQAASLGSGGEVFVLDMGEPVKIIDLARDLIKLSGLEPGVDIEIEITGLRPGEKLSEELVHDTEDSIKTEHEKIFIQDLNTVNRDDLYYYLNKLHKLISRGDQAQIIKTLTQMVDTYQPRRNHFVEKSGEEKKVVENIFAQVMEEVAAAE